MADDTTAETPAEDAPTTSVNSQITDSLEALQAALQNGVGEHAAAMAELARVQATAMRDFQAVARQQSDATIMSATATAAVAKMMSAPYAAGGLGTGVVALAEAQGAAAITMLKSLRDASSEGGGDAAAALDRLRVAATDDPSTAKKAGGR